MENYADYPPSAVAAAGSVTLAPSERGTDSSFKEEMAQYLPHLGKMGEQLRQTSQQIEDSVVAVCISFQEIAERAKAGAMAQIGLLGQDSDTKERNSFERLLEDCGAAMMRLVNASEQSGQVARRAVERIEQIDGAARKITGALSQLESISNGNKILALNARIEAANSATNSAGFAAVAVELSQQTDRSRQVTSEVETLAEQLRVLAGSTLADIQNMQREDARRTQQSRVEVEANLINLRATHAQMNNMLQAQSEESKALANHISEAVRGLQFQDRVSQRIAHVVNDLGVIESSLAGHLQGVESSSAIGHNGFGKHAMFEERAIYGLQEDESPAGDVELF